MGISKIRTSENVSKIDSQRNIIPRVTATKVMGSNKVTTVPLLLFDIWPNFFDPLFSVFSLKSSGRLDFDFSALLTQFAYVLIVIKYCILLNSDWYLLSTVDTTRADYLYMVCFCISAIKSFRFRVLAKEKKYGKMFCMRIYLIQRQQWPQKRWRWRWRMKIIFSFTSIDCI